MREWPRRRMVLDPAFLLGQREAGGWTIVGAVLIFAGFPRDVVAQQVVDPLPTFHEELPVPFIEDQRGNAGRIGGARVMREAQPALGAARTRSIVSNRGGLTTDGRK